MIFNVGAGGTTDADKIKYGDSNVGTTLDNLNNSVDELNESLDNHLTNENNESFNFGYKDGVRGFFTNPSRADDSFIPFKSVPTFVIAGGYRFNQKPYTFTESGTYLVISIDFYSATYTSAPIEYSENVKCTELSYGTLTGKGTSYGGGYEVNIVEVNIGDTIGSEASDSTGLIIFKL